MNTPSPDIGHAQQLAGALLHSLAPGAPPRPLSDTASSVAPTTMVARMVPKRPAGSPARLTLPRLEGHARRMFDADHGFTPLDATPGSEADVIAYLRRIHVDGETTERGGKGPPMFEICTATEAKRIIAREQRDELLAVSGGNKLIAGWSEINLEGIGLGKSDAALMLEQMQAMQARLDGIAAEQAAAREPVQDPNARADVLRVQVTPTPTTAAPAVDLAALRAELERAVGPERAAAMLSAAGAPAQFPPGQPTIEPGA